MTTSMRRGTRIALLWGLIGVFALVPVCLPGTVAAKPYTIDPGPPPVGGDPTADDHPAPAPKPISKAAAGPVRNSGTTGSTTTGGVARPRSATVAWQWILRALTSIALR